MIDSLYRFLAGIGYTDPLHTPLVHFPIGLIFGALCFMVLALALRKKNLELSARHASILALVTVFPTALFGVMDWLHFYRGAMIAPIAVKIVLACVVTVLLTVGIVFGNRVKLGSIVMTCAAALCFLATVGLGWYGYGIMSGRGTSTGLSGSEKAGEPVFASLCQSCHANGRNSVAPELPLKGSKKLSDQASFITFIRAPKMPDGSEGAMPAFTAGDLSDSQAGDLYLYIKSAESGWK